MRLPADIESDIREKVSSGRFENEADVMREALRLLDRQEVRIAELRASVQKGIAEYERGEALEVTDQVWERLEREAKERTARGILPKLDVCP